MASPNRPNHPAAPAASSTPQAIGAQTETDRPSAPAQAPSAPQLPPSPPSPAPAPPAPPREPFFIPGPSSPSPADPKAARPIAGPENARDANPFDPIAFGPQPTIPLLPDALLKKHRAFVPTDTRFRAAARLLQCLWREDRELPIGLYRDAAGHRRKLGSRISTVAGLTGGNFLSPAIARLVERELLYREIGAVIEEERLRQNLLSSQPLCFNLFGPMKLDRGLATAVFDQLLPGFFHEVLDIRFEHAPARGDPMLTGDGTAFDLLVQGRTPLGSRAFAALEIKYTEGCTEPVPRPAPAFATIARASNLFVDPDAPQLRANPLQQLFRQGCLAAVMLQRGLYEKGVHVLIHPRDNHLAAAAGAAYRHQLIQPSGGLLPFVSHTLEGVIEALAATGAKDHAHALHRRYTDFWLVDGELELAIDAAARRTPRSPPRHRSRRAHGAPPPLSSASPDEADGPSCSSRATRSSRGPSAAAD